MPRAWCGMGEAPETALRGRPWRREHPQPPLLRKTPLPRAWALRWRGPMPLSPITRNGGRRQPHRAVPGALRALESFAGLDVIFTKSNADAWRRCHFNALIDEACAQKPGRWAAFTSLGVLRYFRP